VILGFPPARLLVLGALVFFAGAVDALAGGGGLITLPAYFAAGLNPVFLLGTNKLSSSIGTAAACVNYQRGHKLKLRHLSAPIAAALLGSFLGARLSSLLDPNWFKYILLAIIPGVGALVYSKHDFGKTDRSGELTPSALESRSVRISLGVGLYDGFIGPGTGTFMALAFSRWCRYDLLGSTARAKFLNLATNLAALTFFLFAGRVQLLLGLAMGAASLCGNWAGAHLGLKRGADAIRPAVIFVCAGLFAKLAWDCLHR